MLALLLATTSAIKDLLAKDVAAVREVITSGKKKLLDS
jgi:hypothetical protein